MRFMLVLVMAFLAEHFHLWSEMPWYFKVAWLMACMMCGVQDAKEIIRK